MISSDESVTLLKQLAVNKFNVTIQRQKYNMCTKECESLYGQRRTDARHFQTNRLAIRKKEIGEQV